ncbi:hypothetical protein D1631_06210 [Chryseobacterium nematophagum]|uniref:Fibrobacter succinogenes major paralogous domain-containing protein n=1 Tax=Chryseobacterium nematophagum TaxID=2305228 RepID=A0A3M7TD91_9FLAO|nr:hypothetical protein [Chryseobacterium nematophagum]RNA61552.1 hypothetical protein D1631_06210 [Chryseobacterium nematophagum]
MKKTNLLLCTLLGTLAYSQVGVNTVTPKATLDITAKNTDGSTAEGLIVPRFTGNQLFAAIASNVYTMDQHGSMVYVYEPASSDKRVGQTENIDDFGFYYYDGYDNKWNKVGSGATIYRADGTLTNPRHVTMDGKNLDFTGGRIGMGTSSPDPSAILDLTSTTNGFLPPRMTKVQMDAIQFPARALVIYCTDCFGGLGCIMVNDSMDPLVPKWGSLCSTNVPTGDIDLLQCTASTTTGTLHSGIPASGVNVTVPYTGGNGGTYFAGAFDSSGVTGLIANLQGGSLSNGNGNFQLMITGTPSAVGTANFDIMIAGKSCTFSVPVDDFTASVTSLTCSGASFTPNAIIQGQAYTGTLTVPYLGGNGDTYPQMQFTQNGLTFTLPAGTLATGAGNLVYNITGTATSAIAMSIPINFGSTSCNVNKTVTTGGTGGTSNMCMGSGSTREWATHNLGADFSLDPHVGVKGIHGNYYQWGILVPVADADTPPGNISGWNAQAAPNGAWNSGTEDAPVRTGLDPCAALDNGGNHFRVPTYTEWESLLQNNSVSRQGTFVDSATNFGTTLSYSCGSGKMTLPISGLRGGSQGQLYVRGQQGYYWTSTEFVQPNSSYYVFITSAYVQINRKERTDGMSVRCIKE